MQATYDLSALVLIVGCLAPTAPPPGAPVPNFAPQTLSVVWSFELPPPPGKPPPAPGAPPPEGAPPLPPPGKAPPEGGVPVPGVPVPVPRPPNPAGSVTPCFFRQAASAVREDVVLVLLLEPEEELELPPQAAMKIAATCGEYVSQVFQSFLVVPMRRRKGC
jgi:hypothetical protein